MVESQKTLESVKYTLDTLESLKEWGTPYFKESFFKPQIVKPVITYGKNFLQVGRKLDGSVYALDLTEACRILVIGATRSGKTFVLRGLMDRLTKIGKSIVALSDVKNEFWISYKPVQEKFRSGLLEGEKPSGLKIASLRPTFFKQYYDNLPPHNYWYSVNMRTMTKGDFLTLINAKSMTQNQQIAIEILYENLSKVLNKDKDLKFSYSLIEALIEEIEELSASQKQLLAWKFRPLMNSYFFDPTWQRSVISLLQKDFAVAVNMENFDVYGKDGTLQLPEVVLCMVLREVIQSRRSNQIKPLWVFLDEASRFISNDKQNSLKSLLLESYDLDTRYNISYCTATQHIKDMPSKIITQSKYIFVPSTVDTDTLREILLNTGMARNQQYALNQSIYLKKSMSKIKYSWVVLNRMTGKMDLITPLPPTSCHMETSN